MGCRSWKHLMLLPVVVLSVSCERLPDSAAVVVEEPGMIPVEMLEDQQSVPTEWGKLVAVSTGTGPTTRLWFQDEEGTVRMVNYNNVTSLIKPRVRVLRRN